MLLMQAPRMCCKWKWFFTRPVPAHVRFGVVLVFLPQRLRHIDVLDARRFDFIGYPLPGRSVHLALEARY